MEAAANEVLARGRVLRGSLHHWDARPWLRVKLEDVNGGSLGHSSYGPTSCRCPCCGTFSPGAVVRSRIDDFESPDATGLFLAAVGHYYKSLLIVG